MGALSLLALGAPALDALTQLTARVSGQPEGCAFKARYGIDCPGCGGTRAFREASRGSFVGAFRRNALGAMLAVVSWAIVCASALTALTGRGQYLLLTGAVATLALALTTLVHTISWWMALPPGLHWQ